MNTATETLNALDLIRLASNNWNCAGIAVSHVRGTRTVPGILSDAKMYTNAVLTRITILDVSSGERAVLSIEGEKIEISSQGVTCPISAARAVTLVNAVIVRYVARRALNLAIFDVEAAATSAMWGGGPEIE